jgi:hypothetical protein
MYQVIVIKNNQLSVQWFNSQKQAYDFVSTSLVTKYKIYNPNEVKRLDFLNAFYWDEVKKDFSVNIDLAKEIVRIRYRKIRSILFPKLDAAFLRSLEEGDETKKEYIVNLKNQFRNITDFNLPNTEEELYDYVPEVFKEVYDLVI